MDLASIIIQVFNSLCYLSLGVIFIALVRSSWFKGVTGEFVVNLASKLFLDKEKYHLIKDVTLPTEGGSTQIDHIIVSKFGVFVVETKNFKGWIFGSARQKMWSQKIYRHTSKFQNPLFQNYKHTKTLQSLFDLKNEQVFSVIAFVGSSTFKTEMPENVNHIKGYIRFIKSKTAVVFSEDEVKKITTKIESTRLPLSFKAKRSHLKHVKSIVADKNKTQTCPKCGNQMLLRKAKKGPNADNAFWGCSHFPKCRTIVDTK